jgi:hypothetical protein
MAMTARKHAAFKKSQSRSPSKSNFSVLAIRGGQEKYEIASWGEVRRGFITATETVAGKTW